MKDYSQYEEQKYILEFFGDKIGTFLDVGAADGMTFSNVYQLLLNGWAGISVEPESKTLVQLSSLYQQFNGRSEIVVAVVDTMERFVTFYENGQLSSTSQEHIDNWEWHRQQHGYEWRPVTHRTVTLNSLLSHYSDRNIDFISVDIEGNNLGVVSATDWNLASNCKLLCVEHDQDWDSIINCLKPYGFSEYKVTPVNVLLSR